MLTPDEKQRYQRQIILSGWGEEGQEKIKRATVFIAGAGGLGSPVAIYLAAAGIGRIRICDSGATELTNLNRQVLHSNGDIGRNKTRSARETITRINPLVTIETLEDHIVKENAARLVG